MYVTLRNTFGNVDFTTAKYEEFKALVTGNQKIYAIKLMREARTKNQAVRLIGVGVSGLGAPIRQLSLWGAGNEKSRKLQDVVDALQEKYGKNVIHRGR